uniref:VWFA domain-containing protein n=1 Tax=Panagrolaimus sp. ES5 TaxID=591445 RepID=A0AC34FUV0_9BILA
MQRVAFQESTDGNDLTSLWNTDKGRAGIWQTDAYILETLQNLTNYLAENQRTALTEKLQVNITDLNWEFGDLEIPLNSIAVARMFVSNLRGGVTIPFDLDGQANFWEKYYKNAENNATAQDFINNANAMTKCKPPGMDLIFILDSSGSIGSDDFELARNFMVSIINSSRNNENNRFGIVRFSSDATLFLNLTNDYDEATNVAETLPYDGEETNIYSGFELAYEMLARDGRIDVPMVALLITDGQSNRGEDPTDAANDLKSLGVNLFTLGIGAEATTDLNIWASSPNCMFYYSLNGYAQLATVFPDLLNAQICDVSAVAPNTQTSIPGAATVYASLTSRLPSSADYDFVANATAENLGQIYISSDDLQSVQSSSFMFISNVVELEKVDVIVFTAVVGISDATNFTLHYEPFDTTDNNSTATTEAPVPTTKFYSTIATTSSLIRSTTTKPTTPSTPQTTPTAITTTTTPFVIPTIGAAPQSPFNALVGDDVMVYTSIFALSSTTTNFTLIYGPYDGTDGGSTLATESTVQTTSTKLPLPTITTRTSTITTTSTTTKLTPSTPTTTPTTTTTTPSTITTGPSSLATTTTASATTTPTPLITTTPNIVFAPESPVEGSININYPQKYKISANISTGLSLTLNVDNFAILYVSLNSPSVYNYDYYAIAQPGLSGKILISPGVLRNVSSLKFEREELIGDNVMVYATIVGLSSKTTSFTLIYGPDVGTTTVVSTT